MLLSRIAEELHAGLPDREVDVTDIAYDSRKVVPVTASMVIFRSG